MVAATIRFVLRAPGAQRFTWRGKLVVEYKILDDYRDWRADTLFEQCLKYANKVRR